ncbi:hypothetical protein MY8738_002016 [Beauveria namnaoensis]
MSSFTRYAATAPVNPSGVWEGLRRKVCHADQFVPPITSCVVKKEENNVVHRRVVFEGGKEMTEVCTELARRRVDFRLRDGSEIENILAPGPSGELFPTYALKWKFADIEEGFEEEQDLREEQQKDGFGYGAVDDQSDSGTSFE